MNTANGIVGAELIKSYLQSRQMQYFCGHHDDEFFFLVNTYHGRLHVHLQPRDSAVYISITAERYYPADRRAGVAAFAQQWNDTDPQAAASVFSSCDPRLVGVVAERRYHAGDGEIGPVIDQTVQSAIDLFGRLRAAVASSDDAHLRDAG